LFFEKWYLKLEIVYNLLIIKLKIKEIII
jgi:hypothetical protein